MSRVKTEKRGKVTGSKGFAWKWKTPAWVLDYKKAGPR
jgi:hypothetical protein